MTIAEALGTVRYVVDSKGRKTEAILPLNAWKALLAAWKESAERSEDQEDLAIAREWLERRRAGKVETIPLEELERELAADGLV